MSRDRCPHCFLVEECRPCSEGNPPYDREAPAGPSNACVRGCLVFRRHLRDCPAEDRSQGAWLPVSLHGMSGEETRELFFDADTRILAPRWREGVHVSQYGGLETWWPCRGCLPRQATYGALCESCHLRLAGWFAGAAHTVVFTPARFSQQWWAATTLVTQPWTPARGVLVWETKPVKRREWLPEQASIAWAFDWLAADREPGQVGAGNDKIVQGKKVPPAALNLTVHDLRQELAQTLGQWLGQVCDEFKLQGPAWWRRRLTEARRRSADLADMDWRAWVPQTQQEVTSAQAYLHAWLAKVEDVADLAVSIYDTADELMGRVEGVAPWRARPRRLPGIPCPECEAPALAIYEGDDYVTCQRCRVTISRKRYDIWSVAAEHERKAS